MATLDGAPQITELHSFIAESFGAEASAKFLALGPSDHEQVLIHTANDEIRNQFEGKPDSFFPSPTALLIFARHYFVPEAADANPSVQGLELVDAVRSVAKGTRELFAATNHGKPGYAAALRYAIELAETGTLAHYPVAGQPNATSFERLQNILSGDDYVDPTIKREAHPEVEEHVAAEASPAATDSRALTVASMFQTAELSRIGLDRTELVQLVSDLGLDESAVGDLIHINDTGGNTQGAIAILRGGHSMEEVRMVDDLRVLLDGASIQLPEMMDLQSMEESEREQLLASVRNLPVEVIFAFANEFGFSEGSDPSEPGSDLAEAILEVATTLTLEDVVQRSLTRRERKEKVALMVLLEEVVAESKRSPDGTRGDFEKVIERFRRDGE